MAIPKNVRQRMINVMYIVLLALLALQIPKEVTQAFLKINDGIIASGHSLDKIVLANINAIEAKGKNGNEIAVNYAERSYHIRDASDDLYAFIDVIKAKIIETVGVDKKTGKISRPEEVNQTTELLILGEANGINDGLAFELEDKIETTISKMISFLPKERLDSLFPEKYDQIIASLPIKNLIKLNDDLNFSQDWASATFDHMPAAGAMAMLSQMQSDLKTSENLLIEELKTLVDAGAPIFDELAAKMVAPSSYILKGNKFTADLFLAASSSQTDNIVIKANGRTFKPDRNGNVKFEEMPNTVGKHHFSGHIEYTNTATGITEEYPFAPFTYTVAEPYANVSPTKMNLFYKGVKNPIAVSAAGVLPENLVVSVDDGQVFGANGKYEIEMNKLGRTNVYVKDKNGVLHGTYEYRVKRMPKPEARLADQPAGPMKASVFRAQQFLAAVMDDFEFDVRYQIVGYNMVYIPKGKAMGMSSTNNYRFNDQMLKYAQSAKAGDVYAFEDIRVKGPDGIVTKIQGVNYRIIN